MLKNTATTYGTVAKFLHWSIAILLMGMLTFGYFLEDIPEDYKGVVYNVHKLTGLTILFLMLIRVIWKGLNTKPAYPKDMPRLQSIVATSVQHSLCLFAIVMPLAGWIGSSSAGKFPYLGDFKFKLPVPENKTLIGYSFDVHETVAIILIALISVHVLASLYHHYYKKDDVLRRML